MSGLVLASFLVYVDNFSPYFQQSNRHLYYSTDRRTGQNSTMTVSQTRISTQQPHVPINHGRTQSSHIEENSTNNQSNGSYVTSDTNQTVHIVINNNVTTISPESFKELVVMNRHNDSRTVKTTVSSLSVNSTKVTNTTVRVAKNSTKENPPPKSDAELKESTRNKSVVVISTGETTVLTTSKHYDRPNEDLSGYVKVTDLKQVSASFKKQI